MLDEIGRFVNWMRRRNPEAHTWRDYRCDLAQFSEVVGNRPPGEITYKDVDNFVAAQVDAGHMASTINRRLAAVLSFFTFLSDEEPELVCPVLPHRHSLRERRRLPRPVNQTDLEAFFAAIEGEVDNALRERDRAMFLLMLRCGLRLCEVARLKLRDLYLSTSSRQAFDESRMVVFGKNSKERTVYLSKQAVFALRRWLTVRPSVPCDFVFLSYQNEGLSTTSIHKRLMVYRERADIHLTAHQLRHSFANDLVSADVPVTSIQKLLGHAWLSTTQTYVSANDPKVQADFYAAAQQLAGWRDA